MATTPGVTVCFDLGGVLARIRRNWQSCALAVDVRTRLSPQEIVELSHFPLFDPFQLGSFTSEKYLEDLAGFLSVEPNEARLVHDAILDKPYEGTEDLVHDLHSAGHRTACLSNTNELHWLILNSARFPAIESLHFKMVSQDVRLLKPEPEIFQLFDLKNESQPTQVIYFDDNEGNVAAAKQHGWKAIHIDHEADPAAQMRKSLQELEIL